MQGVGAFCPQSESRTEKYPLTSASRSSRENFLLRFQALTQAQKKETSQGGGVWVESALANPFNDPDAKRRRAVPHSARYFSSTRNCFWVAVRVAINSVRRGSERSRAMSMRRLSLGSMACTSASSSSLRLVWAELVPKRRARR